MGMMLLIFVSYTIPLLMKEKPYVFIEGLGKNYGFIGRLEINFIRSSEAWKNLIRSYQCWKKTLSIHRRTSSHPGLHGTDSTQQHLLIKMQTFLNCAAGVDGSNRK